MDSSTRYAADYCKPKLSRWQIDSLNLVVVYSPSFHTLNVGPMQPWERKNEIPTPIQLQRVCRNPIRNFGLKPAQVLSNHGPKLLMLNIPDIGTHPAMLTTSCPTRQWAIFPDDYDIPSRTVPFRFAKFVRWGVRITIADALSQRARTMRMLSDGNTSPSGTPLALVAPGCYDGGMASSATLPTLDLAFAAAFRNGTLTERQAEQFVR